MQNRSPSSLLLSNFVLALGHSRNPRPLQFGQLCKTIKNNAKKNERVDEKTLLKQYRSKISELTHQLAIERGGEGGSGTTAKRNVTRTTSRDMTEAKLREALDHSDELQQKLDKLSDLVIKRGIPNAASSSSLSKIGLKSADVQKRNRSASLQVVQVTREFLEEQGRAMGVEDGGAEAAKASFRDMALLQQAHGEELSKMYAHIEELENLVEGERGTCRKMRDELHMKDDYIQDLYKQNEELVEAENEKLESQENARREIQEYHDLRQQDLDKLQEKLDAEKDQTDAQQASLEKRSSKLEETEAMLSNKLAFLDEKESELQQQMNQLTENIMVWEAEKGDLERREGDVLQWSKNFKAKEWQLEEKEKVISDKEAEQLNKEKELVKFEQMLNNESALISDEKDKVSEIRMKTEAKEKTIEADWDDLTKWKRLLKEREIEVEERERSCKKREEIINSSAANISKHEKELQALKLELNAKADNLIVRENQVEKDQASIKRLKPALDSRSRDLDHRQRSVEEEEAKVEKLSVFCKELSQSNEEKQLELNVKMKHLEEREREVLGKESLHKHLDDLKTSLKSRELKQKIKEDQWMDNVARVNAEQAATLKQTDELLMAQIETTRTYEVELNDARAEVEVQKKEKDAALAILKQLQEKMEKLADDEQAAAGKFGNGGLQGHRDATRARQTWSFSLGSMNAKDLDGNNAVALTPQRTGSSKQNGEHKIIPGGKQSGKGGGSNGAKAVQNSREALIQSLESSAGVLEAILYGGSMESNGSLARIETVPVISEGEKQGNKKVNNTVDGIAEKRHTAQKARAKPRRNLQPKPKPKPKVMARVPVLKLDLTTI